MLNYSKKYPKIFEAKKAQIQEWKQFVLEMDHILYLEQEEKVEQWYLEREEKKHGPGGAVNKEEKDEAEREKKQAEEQNKQRELLEALEATGKVSTR